MFDLSNEKFQTIKKSNGQLLQKCNEQDIHYQICSSYIKYASEKLALREAIIMDESSEFMSLFNSRIICSKEATDNFTTEPSINCISDFTSENEIQKSMNSEKKIAFRRKTAAIYLSKKEESNITNALEEVKYCCSQSAFLIFENLIKEYKQLIKAFNNISQKEVTVKKKKQFYIPKDTHSVNKGKIKEMEKQIEDLRNQNNQMMNRINELVDNNTKWEIKERNRLDQNKIVLDTSLTYLSDREQIVKRKSDEVRIIEDQISRKLEYISSEQGCARCQVVKAIKESILKYRRLYEKQSDNLDKLYLKYKKLMR